MACLKKLWRKEHGSFTPTHDSNGIIQPIRYTVKTLDEAELAIQRRRMVAASLQQVVQDEDQEEESDLSLYDSSEAESHEKLNQIKPPSYLEELKEKQAQREKKLKEKQISIEVPTKSDYQVITLTGNQNSIQGKNKQPTLKPATKSTPKENNVEDGSATPKKQPYAPRKSISFADQPLIQSTRKNHTNTHHMKPHIKTHKNSKNTKTEVHTPPIRKKKSVKKEKEQTIVVNTSVQTNGATPRDTVNPEKQRKSSKKKSSAAQDVRKGVIFMRPELEGQDDFVEAYEKDEKTRELIKKAIEANDFLNNYMDDERKKLVINAMEPVRYPKGSYIIRENEEGSEIYVSEEGCFDVIKNGVIVNSLGPGCVFGELAILYNAKRLASIVASENSKVWKISREKFRLIIITFGNKEREENLNFLKSVPLLKDLNPTDLVKFVDLLKRIFFPANTRIVKQGDIGNDFFIIRGGSVTIKKVNESGEEKIVDIRKRGDYFGEQALLNADCRQASVFADPPGTECLKLDREAFMRYIGSIPDLKEKPVDKNIIVPLETRNSSFGREYAHIKLEDLQTVGILGCGGFGRVELVKYQKETYALKILKKIEVVQQQQINHVYSEKMVMALCHSDFIVKLYRTFRDNKYVYFLMEPCLGGDVFSILFQKKYFEEEVARFIVGCVVEAFDYLHNRNIVYRDLKPENLMVTPNGYCKLVDFGFAKLLQANTRTNTFAGTPEYVAPEIVMDRGHDKGVDYWALGILIHELLSGGPPFRGKDQIRIYQQIITGIDFVRMPSRISKTAQNLIKNLCRQNPAERIGCQRKGVADIRNHGWFSGFKWEQLQNRTMTAPIRRPVRSNTDLRYFSPPREDDDNVPEEMSGWDSAF